MLPDHNFSAQIHKDVTRSLLKSTAAVSSWRSCWHGEEFVAICQRSRSKSFAAHLLTGQSCLLFCIFSQTIWQYLKHASLKWKRLLCLWNFPCLIGCLTFQMTFAHNSLIGKNAKLQNCKTK